MITLTMQSAGKINAKKSPHEGKLTILIEIQNKISDITIIIIIIMILIIIIFFFF
jgi:hypothetical protein